MCFSCNIVLTAISQLFRPPPRLVHPLNAILVNDRGRVLHFIASMDDLIDGTVQKYAVMDLVWQTSAKVLSNR